MGKKERDKGARGERMLRDKFNECGYENVKRGFVWNKTSDLIGLKGIHIEAKFVERLNIRAALRQAQGEAEKRNDGMPAVFSKTSREPWIVTMYFDDWVKLYSKYEQSLLPFEE